MAVLTDAEFETSTATPNAPFGSAAATCSAPLPSISATATVAPASARRLQIASPMPVAPPVTIAVCPLRSNGMGSVLAAHVHGHIGDHILVQPDGNLMLTQRANRLIELNLPPVHGVLLRREPVCDIRSRDRAEELIVLARLPDDRDRHRAQQLRQILRFALQFRFFAQVRLALLLHDLAVGVRRRYREALRQQKVPRVTRRDLHHLPARAEPVDVFTKYDFHVSSSFTPTPRTATARYSAP